MTTCERTPEPRTDPPQEPARREPTREEVDACVELALRGGATGVPSVAAAAAEVIDTTLDDLIHRATMPSHLRKPWWACPNEGTGWEIWEGTAEDNANGTGKRIAVVWDVLAVDRIVADHNYPLGELTDLRAEVESALARMHSDDVAGIVNPK